MKYIAKVLDKIEDSPNAWKGLKVGVFKIENKIEEQVGEYERNYPNLFNTFHHFQKDGKDFALYSPDYTTTRMMDLPSCKDIGGEDRSAGGFCPTDYFIPTYIEQETIWETTSFGERIGGNVLRKRLNNPKEEDLTESVDNYEFVHQTSQKLCKNTISYRPLTPLAYYPFGFIAGCIWGDDSSWKIQYVDLSEVESGVIKREERFGYIELPDKMSLQDAIEMSGYENNSEDYSNYIRIKHIQTFNLSNGKIVDPFE